MAAGFAATSCSDDSDSGSGVFRVEWDPTKTVHPDREGAAVLVVDGREGISWRAEITAGADWVSFNRTAPGGQTVKTGIAGTSLAARNQYVYYWPNDTRGERHAMIRFTFDGQAPLELELTQYSTSAADDVYQTGHNLVWPEIPARKSDDAYVYVTHFALLRNQNTGVTYNARNFTMCFDKTKFAAWWVAYPLHSAYTGSGRVETWAYDPKIAAEYQANLTKSYPARNFDRRAPDPQRRPQRECHDAGTDLLFLEYDAPELQPEPESLGGAREDGARQLDVLRYALWVVTGAYWNPGSTFATPRYRRQAVSVPNYYFKVFVRTVKGNVRQAGDRLGDYPADQLKSIGFWVENAGGQGTARSWVKSVSEVESLTGFEFFPSVPAAVKAQKDAASWGL